MEGVWEEVGIQKKKFWKLIDGLIIEWLNKNNNCYEYRIRSLKLLLLQKLYIRIGIGSDLEFSVPGEKLYESENLEIGEIYCSRGKFHFSKTG